jgi:indoleamine 2,3-dioxygenase
MSYGKDNQGDLLAPLAAYGISPITGFVPPIDPLETLSSEFQSWEAVARDLPSLIRSRRLRAEVTKLSILDPLKLESDRARERALLLLTVLGNAWVWGDREPNLVIPKMIAQPLCKIANALDRPPIVHYASMALNNWRRLDINEPVSSDNAQLQIRFTGGVDEDWFFIASIGVELEGAPLTSLARTATIGSHYLEDSDLAAVVCEVASSMDPILCAVRRMREWCDPYIYYHRVRPYFAGWPVPGIIYEGVFEAPQLYVGGSAAQSSLIQAIDALLGINHGSTTAGAYLRAMRRYMPIAHRRFVEDVELKSMLRSRVANGNAYLREAYNEAVQKLTDFRHVHMGLAHDYIARPSKLIEQEKGTGGTTFIDFLHDTRHSTISAAVAQSPGC